MSSDWRTCPFHGPNTWAAASVWEMTNIRTNECNSTGNWSICHVDSCPVQSRDVLKCPSGIRCANKGNISWLRSGVGNCDFLWCYVWLRFQNAAHDNSSNMFQHKLLFVQIILKWIHQLHGFQRFSFKKIRIAGQDPSICLIHHIGGSDSTRCHRRLRSFFLGIVYRCFWCPVPGENLEKTWRIPLGSSLFARTSENLRNLLRLNPFLPALPCSQRPLVIPSSQLVPWLTWTYDCTHHFIRNTDKQCIL